MVVAMVKKKKRKKTMTKMRVALVSTIDARANY